MGGPGAAASGVSGLVVGHLWWWSVFADAAGGGGGNRGAFGWVRAPGWLRSIIGDGPGGVSGSATGGTGGVHVVPPRRLAAEAASGSSSGGHQWGSGNRLGS
jgi:Derlin-2/3